jgi:hypothetical protein
MGMTLLNSIAEYVCRDRRGGPHSVKRPTGQASAMVSTAQMQKIRDQFRDEPNDQQIMKM